MDRLLERDGFVKALAVLLAVIIWVQVSSERGLSTQRTFEGVTVAVQNTAPGLLVTGPPAPWRVKIEVQGDPRILERLRPEEVRAGVDLGAAEVGSGLIPVTVELPPGVRLVSVYPDRLNVTLEREMSKSLPVNVILSGEAPDDTVLGEPGLGSATVQVAGPQSLVSRVEQVVLRLSVAGADGDIDAVLPLVALDRDGHEVSGSGLRLSPDAVPVQMTVRRVLPGKQVRVQANLVGAPLWGLVWTDLHVAPAEVLVRGAPEHHGAWREIATEEVSIGDREGPFEVEVGLVLPPGAQSVEPDRVRVAVRLDHIQGERLLAAVPVQVSGLDADLQAGLEPTAVAVAVHGPVRELESLDATAVSAAVDVSGLAPGLYTLPLIVAGPEGLVIRAAAETVEVTLAATTEE